MIEGLHPSDAEIFNELCERFGGDNTKYLFEIYRNKQKQIDDLKDCVKTFIEEECATENQLSYARKLLEKLNKE